MNDKHGIELLSLLWVFNISHGIRYQSGQGNKNRASSQIGIVSQRMMEACIWWSIFETLMKVNMTKKMWGAFGPFIQLVDDVEILVGSYNGFIFLFSILFSQSL